MIRFITTKRLRELEKNKELLETTQRQFMELNRICDAWRARYSELQGKYIAVKFPERDLGAESRKRNAEQLVADSQKARRNAEEDVPSTFPGLWSLGPSLADVDIPKVMEQEHGIPRAMFGEAPADSFAGGGATASYEAPADTSTSSSSDSSSSDSGSSSTTTND